MSVIETNGLTKYYGENEVVGNLDLRVDRGKMFGFLGPNGAGKSTTVSMLTTLTTPTAGIARVADFDVRKAPFEVRKRISVVFQDTTLDEDLTCVENLWFQARLLNIPRQKVRARINQCLEIVGLLDSAEATTSQMSGGMRRRLEIARAILAEPEVMFLDEPTTGLDPQTRRAVWEYLTFLVKENGMTLFLTTHHLDEAEICDTIAIIDRGSVVAEGDPSSLKSAIGQDRITFTPDSDLSVAANWVTNILGQPKMDGRQIILRTKQVADTLGVLFREAPFEVGELSVHRPTLDDVFLKYTGVQMRDREVDSLTTDMIGEPR